ncbi:MAG: Xaa-His dipeptidase [Clostridium sp.]|uniref:Xaa-His dipeptidase n=1 Tax=Clostridium sp. TaxID=1506 RepID=UPI003D6C84BE
MKSNEDKIIDALPLIETMVEQGATDKEIAVKIDVGYSTYRKYKAENAELKAIVSQGKVKKNQAVEQALYNNAIGYYYKEEIATKVKVEELASDNETILAKEIVVISSIEKYKGPDLAAEKYWLNNKEKARWRDDPNKVDNDKKLTKLKEKEVNAKTEDI